MMGRARGDLAYTSWWLGWLARRARCAIIGHQWTPQLPELRTVRCDDCGTVRGLDHA